MLNATSGIRHRPTCVSASVAKLAMNPESRPISFTKPIPDRWHDASTYAARVAWRAASTAVSNPNDISMKEMSLSINEGDVVVDRLRHTHHGDLQLPSPYLLDDRMR